MLKEARIILPAYDNTNNPLTGEHTKLRMALTVAFGGFTLTLGHGTYVTRDGAISREPVSIYDVAMPDDDNAVLITIAGRVAFAARQETVYVRLPDGTVHFVPPSPGRSGLASEFDAAGGTDLAEALDDVA